LPFWLTDVLTTMQATIKQEDAEAEPPRTHSQARAWEREKDRHASYRPTPCRGAWSAPILGLPPVAPTGKALPVRIMTSRARRFLCYMIPFSNCRAESPPIYLDFGSIRSMPLMYGLSASGMVTLPSSFWKFSNNGISILGEATAVLFRV
jgi:hypothetical protein